MTLKRLAIGWVYFNLLLVSFVAGIIVGVVMTDGLRFEDWWLYVSALLILVAALLNVVLFR